MEYKEALDFLYSQLPMYQRVGKSAFKKDLTNTIKLCELLGSPEKRFKSVHIAGTNGKGTTAHLLASIFQEAGYRTGLYTSPHLKNFTERIKISGIEVEKAFVSEFVSKIQHEIEHIQPSFFELTVAMAFDYFSKKEVDIAVIETGLGGRLDSTNVITPELSIITNIGLDHQEMLGNTIEEIAMEKAGIIKKNIPVILGMMPKKASETIKNVADNIGSKVNENHRDYSIEREADGSLQICKKDRLVLNNLLSGINGSYIVQIIPHVLEAVDELNQKGLSISQESVIRGFQDVVPNTDLKGRWQHLSKDPLIICDVAHNIDGIKQVLSQIMELDFNTLHVVFGTVTDKTVEDILELLPKAAKYYFCSASVPRAMDVDILYSKAKQYGLEGGMFPTVNDAISYAKNNAKKDDLIFIGGSTFVVAEIANL